MSSGGVGRQYVLGEGVAIEEHVVDRVDRPAPVAGRTTRPEWRLELQLRDLLPPCPQANETPRLTWQIVQRQLEGLEP